MLYQLPSSWEEWIAFLLPILFIHNYITIIGKDFFGGFEIIREPLILRGEISF